MTTTTNNLQANTNLPSLSLSRKENLIKIKQNFEEILKGIDDVVCTDHTKLKTIYIEQHPDTPGKGGFICDYCSNPCSRMKFYSQILSDYAEVINQIKRAAAQKNEFSLINASNTIEHCSELNSQVEFSYDSLKNLTADFDQFFIPGVFAKIATSEELLKLNEILKTISFNEKGKPIYESIGTHPERETQYVKLAKILISFKDEHYDMNQKFSAVLQEFITRLIQSRFEVVRKTTDLIKFLTSEFYEFIFKLDGIPGDHEFRNSLKYMLYPESEWDLVSKKLQETQENFSSERSLRLKLEEEFKSENADLLCKLKEYEQSSDLAFAQEENQEALFEKRFEALKAEYENEAQLLRANAQAEKAQLLKQIEILQISVKQNEEKLNFTMQNSMNVFIKFEESEKNLRSKQKAFDELKLNFDLQAYKLKDLDELTELRVKCSEALLSRKNLIESFNNEKLLLQSKIKEFEAENAYSKNRFEINIKNESTIISLNSKIIELNAKLNSFESKLSTEASISKSLQKDKLDLLEQLKAMSLEISSLSVKNRQMSEEAKQYLDLSSLNGSLLSDLKKQVNINRNFELKIQELQEKINRFNSRAQANEQLIKHQLEVIRRYTDDKVAIPVEEKSEMLMNSKKETEMIIEKIERLERDPLYKSIIINLPASNNINNNNFNNFNRNYDSNNSYANLLDASFAKSVANSAFRPSSPVLCASGQGFKNIINQKIYSNSKEDLSSLLVSNSNAVSIKALNANYMLSNNNSNNSNYNNKDSKAILNNVINNNNINANNLISNLLPEISKRSASVKLLKKPFKINFSSDLLLNNENWDSIRSWIESTDIFLNSIQPKLLFKASRDGFSYKEFQKRCCGLKNTLVIAKTSLGKVIGGFTPLAWIVPSEPYIYVEDPNSETFLFSVDLSEKYDLKPQQFAICLSQKNGPIFGGGSDFEIVDFCDSQFNKSCNIGHSFFYSKTPEAFYGAGTYLVSEYEVYQIL